MWAVVAVQTLSVLHGVVHMGRAAQAIVEAQSPLPGLGSVAPSTATAPSSWLDAMFAHHAGHDCDAFDQASHADLVVALPSGVVAVLLCLERTAVHLAWHVAAQARGFLARGPPVVA
jgi:hypothetical protein